MAQKIKGKCKYCGKEYTGGYMGRHLGACKARQARIMEEKGSRRCGYFELKIYFKYDNDYWLFVEVSENATLKDLDTFLRDIWLECCGHLSAFRIGEVSYESMPADDFFWGRPPQSMNHKLKTVLEKGMTIDYEYDFGSTTELKIAVSDYRVGYWKKEKLTLLSRNNPQIFLCDNCGQKPAVIVRPEYMWGGKGFLCEDCEKKIGSEDDFVLNVCNSPRMGVCGYEGSSIYPDQFEPD